MRLLLALFLTATAFAAPKPNIVFLLADDLGYGDLGCHGQKKIRTPNIDKLATQGLRFTNCYAGNTVCAPSRCVLYTGRDAGHARIRGNFARAGGLPGPKVGQTVHRANLLAEDTTLAAVLSKSGYRTALVNKWHLDGFDPKAGPLDRGFDEFKGWLVSAPSTYASAYWPSQRFDQRDLKDVPANLDGKHGRHNTTLTVDEAIGFLDQPKTAPFFLVVAFSAPHDPWEPPSQEPYASETWTDTQKNYAALTTHLDTEVGRLLSHLDSKGLAENTVVFFTSDNGAAKSAPREFFNSCSGLRGCKGDLYEGGIRVPMIVRWPGQIPAGKTSDAVWSFVDFMPTALEIADAEYDGDLDGSSVLDLLKTGEARERDRLYYWEFPEKELTQAAREGKWKVVRPAKNAPLELYDLSTDPNESKDVAKDHPELIAHFEDEMKAHREASEHWPD
jgi:arylsulfatase A-like enzyme